MFRALYVSGVPGVGKTAIVNKVVRELMLLSTDSDLPQFKYIFLNGMKLNKPEKIYVQFLQVNARSPSRSNTKLHLSDFRRRLIRMTNASEVPRWPVNNYRSISRIDRIRRDNRSSCYLTKYIDRILGRISFVSDLFSYLGRSSLHEKSDHSLQHVGMAPTTVFQINRHRHCQYLGFARNNVQEEASVTSGKFSLENLMLVDRS